MKVNAKNVTREVTTYVHETVYSLDDLTKDQLLFLSFILGKTVASDDTPAFELYREVNNIAPSFDSPFTINSSSPSGMITRKKA